MEDDAEYLWLVITTKDIYSGLYLTHAIYQHAPQAIELAETHQLKGVPLIEEDSSSQGNIVFFIRSKPNDKDGWYRATSVERLKTIRKLSFEDYDKNYGDKDYWNFMKVLPENVREIELDDGTAQ